MERAIIQTNNLRFSYTTAAGAAPLGFGRGGPGD